MRLPGYIFSFLLLITLRLEAQAQDTLELEQKRYTVDLAIDYGKLLETAINEQVKWEFGIGILLADHYNITGEYGYGLLRPENVINNGSYSSEGNYFRVGIDYYFEVAPKQLFSTGVLFANSNFSDQGEVIIESEIWDDLNRTFARTNLAASWLELVFNTEGAIFKNEKPVLSSIYWGSKLRIRMMIHETATEQLDIFAVPGYGRRFSNVSPAINVFLKYKFQIK